MKRSIIRAGALAGAAVLATVTAAPGYAATVSRGTASAITVDVAGMDGGDSGTVTATNDGSGQQKTGMSQPPAPAVPSMGALDLGVLAQDATARVANGQGRSAACAGIVGNDGAVLQVGEGFCLTPGDDAALDLDLGTLELPPELGPGQDQVQAIVDQVLGSLPGGLPSVPGGGDPEEDPDPSDGGLPEVPDPSDGGLPETPDPSDGGLPETPGETPAPDGTGDGSPLEDGLADLTSGGAGSGNQPSGATSPGSQGSTTQNASYQPATVEEPLPDLDPAAVMDAVQAALDELDGGLGDFGIAGSLGAVQAICSAGPGLSGDASLADAGFTATGAGQEVNLLSLPADPAPNTHLTTDLGDVVDLVITDLRANLTEQLQPLGDGLGQAQDQVIDEVVGQVQAQLAPLEENVLDVTLNKQTRSGGTIHVTALDAQVLPAARDQLGASLVSLQVGDVTCSGGSLPVQAQGGQTPTAPVVPTVVSSGQPSSGQPSDGGLPAGVIGGILALLGASALVGYRRVTGR